MIYVLILLGLFGLLPLVIILIRKNRNDKLRKHGVATTCTVTQLFGMNFRSINLVEVKYRVIETGETITKNLRIAGVPYAVGDELPIFYDPSNPKHMQLDMKKGFVAMLVFTLIIAIAIIWACFKLNQMVNNGEI
jgi:hypothetical protein